MEKATEKQINLIENLIQFTTNGDYRFLKMQGYFINSAKKNMTKNEAMNIIKYIQNKTAPKPDCFNKYICFDYGWNKWALKEVNLATNNDGMPMSIRNKMIRKEITKKEAQEMIKQIEHERFDFLLKLIEEYKKEP